MRIYIFTLKTNVLFHKNIKLAGEWGNFSSSEQKSVSIF